MIQMVTAFVSCIAVDNKSSDASSGSEQAKAKRKGQKKSRGRVNSDIMRIRICTVAFCVAATMSLATSTAAPQNNRSQTINAEGLFTFRLPIGFKQTETGVDSFMRGYQRGRARFIFVCGDSASSDYDEKSISNLREDSIVIDGKPATVRTFIYKFPRASLYITELNVGNWRDGNVELYMAMDSPNRADSKIAKRIFRSVKFLKRKSK